MVNINVNNIFDAVAAITIRSVYKSIKRLVISARFSKKCFNPHIECQPSG